jgi:MFS family permease
MGLTTALAVACALSVLGGAGNGVQWVAVMTRLQEETPETLQARVIGLFESVASITTGVGFLIGGVLTAVTAPETAFLVAGAGVIALVAAGGVALRPRRPPAAPSGGASGARR